MLNFPSKTRGGTPATVSTGIGRMGRGLMLGLAAGTAAVTIAACGSSAPAAQGSGSGSGSGDQATAPTANVAMTLQLDADKGPAGWITGKEDWPRYVEGDGTSVPKDYQGAINLPANTTVTLTIAAHDDMVTALPKGSPYNDVLGGTETVDGQTVTTVSNKVIAHTITVPDLGINIPIPKAPEGGTVNVTFTFKTGAGGTYTWKCMTPCGGGKKGMDGAMATKGWMQGTFVVA